MSELGKAKGRARASFGVALARRAAFVVVNTGIVAAGAYGWSRVYSVLADPQEVLLPLLVLAIPLSFALHVIVLPLHSHFARAFALYAAFVSLLLAHGAYLHVGLHDPEPWLYVGVLVFGHLFGLPLLAIAGVVNKLLSPLLCPRPA